jgi:DNA polymerase-3 subunit delta'
MWRVTGQENVISLLDRSLEKKSLSHAFLISGPPHVGKMTLAVDIAQAINCGGKNPPCGECESCIKIQQGKHADIQIISLIPSNDEEEGKARTEIGIDDIRQIQHTVSLPPFEGKHKAFIIEGAESMSLEAANCLLKTLEEPATQAVFMLLTTNAGLLPETIISRCQRITLNPIAASQIEKTLIADYDIESRKAALLSRLSNGCFGWALSAAQDEKMLEEYFEKRSRIMEVMASGLQERFSYAGTLSTQFSKDRMAVYDIMDLWLDIWRDMLLLKAGLPEAVNNIDVAADLKQRAAAIDMDAIRKSIQAIQEAKAQLDLNANARLVLEVMILDVPVMAGNIVKG